MRPARGIVLTAVIPVLAVGALLVSAESGGRSLFAGEGPVSDNGTASPSVLCREPQLSARPRSRREVPRLRLCVLRRGRPWLVRRPCQVGEYLRRASRLWRR